MAAVVIMFGSVIRRPGMSDVDPVGVRTVATFRGDSPEFFAQDHDGPLVGIQLSALCDGLARKEHRDRAAGHAPETPSGPSAWSGGSECAGAGVGPRALGGRRGLGAHDPGRNPPPGADPGGVISPRDSLAARPVDRPGRLAQVSPRLLVSSRWYRKEELDRRDLSDAGGGPLT